MQILENQEISVDDVHAHGVYVDTQNMLCQNGATQTADKPLPVADVSDIVLELPLASDNKIRFNTSKLLYVTNQASNKARNFEFVVDVEPPVTSVPGVELVQATDKLVAAAGGGQAHVQFQVNRKDYNNQKQVFTVTFQGTGPDNLKAVTRVYLQPYTTELPPPPQCTVHGGAVPCPDPTGGGKANSGVVIVTSPFPWLVWVLVTLAVIVSLFSMASVYWWWTAGSRENAMKERAARMFVRR